jgi:phosphomannomutase
LANSKKTIKQLRNTYPDYFMSKNKIALENGIDVKDIFEKIKVKYKNQPINTDDGLKIEFDTDWVHLRTSNTEPIIRIYAESNFETTSDNIAKRLMQDIQEMVKTSPYFTGEKGFGFITHDDDSKENSEMHLQKNINIKL